jgi:hypothetical protein
MWKYNTYDIGDKVGHREALNLIFEVVNVLPSEPEEIGKYLYCCKIYFQRRTQDAPAGWETPEEIAEDLNNPEIQQIDKVFKYDETVLYSVRLQAFTINELKTLLKEALDNEQFEKAGLIRDEMNKQEKH